MRAAAPRASNPAQPPPEPRSLPGCWVRTPGVGSPRPPPLTSRRPSPQVSEAGASGGPRTSAGLGFPTGAEREVEEEEE